MSLPEITTDQLVGGIENALRARNFEAVRDFLTVLAIRDPERADVILKALEVGAAFGRERRDPAHPPTSEASQEES